MTKRLTSLFAITALILAASGSAFAADMAVKMPVKAPPPPPAPVYSWTGWYVGVNAGASMGEAKTNLNGSPLFSTSNFGPGVVQFTSGFGIPNDKEYPDGFIGGGQIGYNWQYSPLIVVGLEADIQGALEKATNTLAPQGVNFVTGPAACGMPIFTTSCTATTGYTTQIDWFGTVRARLGYVWGNGEVLTYVTGGLAYGEVKINGTSTVSGPAAGTAACVCDFTFSQTQTIGQSHINTGWVLGYGTEGHLPLMPGNWTWKIESLYMDLGHLNATSSTSGSSCAVFASGGATLCAVNGGQVATNTHFTDWILRGGLNYHF
jgi:outer membrane immunogenic protein